MPIGKQAKVLSDAQIKGALSFLEKTRYPERDTVLFLLSTKAGLRAKEISLVTWSMLTDAEGRVGNSLALENKATKGSSGREIPLHPWLKSALAALKEKGNPDIEDFVISSERGERLTANSVVMWFRRLYDGLGFDGCSSHSGRRTFITNASRKATAAGASLRDVQQLAGHSSLNMTQRYIEGSSEAKHKLVSLL